MGVGVRVGVGAGIDLAEDDLDEQRVQVGADEELVGQLDEGLGVLRDGPPLHLEKQAGEQRLVAGELMPRDVVWRHRTWFGFRLGLGLGFGLGLGLGLGLDFGLVGALASG